MFPIVIVGAGHAGGRTALTLREAGWSGPVVLVGDEPEPPYERPQLSKGVLTGEPFTASLAPAGRYAEAGIEWIGNCRVTAIDRANRAVCLGNGRLLPYHALVLATGGRARNLAIPGMELAAVSTLRTLADAARLAPRLEPASRVVVVGGGFIGLEVAASARARGCTVTVLEAGDRLLGRAVPAALASRVRALHERQGVSVRTGLMPTAFEPQGDAIRVSLADGTSVPADTIVVGIGITPNVELAAAAGLECANGIVVDRNLRTADPAILAIGDVAAFPSSLPRRPVRLESWHNAEDHARVAAAVLAGGEASICAAPWFWSDQYDHQLQIAGDPARGAMSVTRALAGDGTIDFHLDMEGRLVGLSGFALADVLAKEFRVARMLLERHALPPAAALSDPAVQLKSLLPGSRP